MYTLKLVSILAALLFVTFSCYVIFSHHKLSNELKNNFNNLGEKRILQISIQKGDYLNPSKIIKTITEPEIIKEFVSLSKDLESYTPNHPCYSSKYLIEIMDENNGKIQLLFYEQQSSKYIYIALVRSRESGISYCGNFKSKKLYHWLKMNINLL